MFNKEKRSLKNAYTNIAKRAVLRRIYVDKMTPAQACAAENIRTPARLAKTIADWMEKFPREVQPDAPWIPVGHMSTKRVEHPCLVARMIMVYQDNPTITLRGLYAETRATKEYATAGRPSQRTLQRYWQKHVKPVVSRRKVTTQNEEDAEAYIAKFQKLWDAGDHNIAINFDACMWFYRHPGKPALGVTDKIDGPAIGIYMTSWLDGRRPTDISVASESRLHNGLRWEDMTNLVKTDATTHWVTRDAMVDQMRKALIDCPKDSKPLIVLDNCAMHVAGLAREAMWAEEMKVGGAVCGDGKITLHVPRGFAKPLAARQGFNFKKAGPHASAAANVDAKYKPLADKMHKCDDIWLDDGDIRCRIAFLPPRTTAILQPCDLSIFGPMKRGWKIDWMGDAFKARGVGAEWGPFLKTVTYADAFKYLNTYIGTMKAEQIQKGWDKLFGR